MNHVSGIHRCLFPLLLLSAITVSCGPGVEEGPIPKDTEAQQIQDSASESAEPDTDAADTGDTGGDTGEETDTADVDAADIDTIDTDTSPENWCGYPTIRDAAVVSSENLLEGGRFVGIGSDCVLAVRQEETGFTAMAAFMDAAYPGKIIGHFESPVSLEPRALTCRFDSAAGTHTAHVLTSNESESVVYELVDQSGIWTERYRGPRLQGIHQMVRTAAPAVDEVCAFGDGIFCATKSSGWTDWRQEIPSGTGVLISDIALISCEEGWCPTAVGQAGHVYLKQQSEWQQISVDTTADLLTVSAKGDVFTAAGRGGVILHGNADKMTSHIIMDGRDIVSLYWSSDRYFKGVTADGVVFEGEMNSDEVYICPDPDSVSGPILDGVFSDCGANSNFLVLREDALLGEYECSIVII